LPAVIAPFHKKSAGDRPLPSFVLFNAKFAAGICVRYAAEKLSAGIYQ
jgi:hypothetical protein